MKFSLILATLDRKEEVGNFLESLRGQSLKDFQLIIVDQNKEQLLDDLVREYGSFFPIKHIRIGKKGLSLARNIGLKHAIGEIITFPDDDCEYPPRLLETIDEFFIKNRDYQIVTGRSVDKETKKPNCGKLSGKNSSINYGNVFQTGVSISIFVRFSGDETLFFNEKIGAGTFFGSAEETDYLFKLLQRGYKGLYCPETVFVYHPTDPIGCPDKILRKKAYVYSLGMGAFFKQHLIMEKSADLIPMFVLFFLVAPVSGVLQGLITNNPNKILLYRDIFSGRWKGLIKYSNSQ